MANEKNLTKGKKFTSENQPAKRGRRKSQIADFITSNVISLADLRKTLQGVGFDRSVAELEALEKDKDIPAMISCVASAVLADRAKGRLDTYIALWDRCYGRPTQVIEAEVQVMSDESKRRMLSIFQEETKGKKVKPKIVLPRKKAQPKQPLDA